MSGTCFVCWVLSAWLWDAPVSILLPLMRPHSSCFSEALGDYVLVRVYIYIKVIVLIPCMVEINPLS